MFLFLISIFFTNPLFPPPPPPPCYSISILPLILLSIWISTSDYDNDGHDDDDDYISTKCPIFPCCLARLLWCWLFIYFFFRLIIFPNVSERDAPTINQHTHIERKKEGKSIMDDVRSLLAHHVTSHRLRREPHSSSVMSFWGFPPLVLTLDTSSPSQ